MGTREVGIVTVAVVMWRVSVHGGVECLAMVVVVWM